MTTESERHDSERRLKLVAIVYVLSLPAMFTSLGLWATALKGHQLTDQLVLVLWPTAWVMHALLSLAWILGRKLHVVWSAMGLLSGVGSIAVTGPLWPFALLLTAPASLLAVVLIGFQAQADGNAPDATVDSD